MSDQQSPVPQGKKRGRKWVRRLLPLVILTAGAGSTLALVSSRKPPPRKPPVDRGVLVRAIAARAERRTVRVAANGVIQPRREVSIAPEVNGRVRWTNLSLVVGGLIERGQPLLVIDGADYKLALRRAQAQVAQAERALAEARSSARVARREWKVLGKRVGGSQPTPLTLHEPQLKAAEAALAAARADVQQAKLNLSRALIRAPFNVRVRQKNVDVGQYVRVGQTIAVVYGTDVAEVIVSLPTAELRWLTVPKSPAVTRASPERLRGPGVTVRLQTGAGSYERRGTLVRSVGEVDPSGRMSKVVVAVADPFNLKREAGEPYLPSFEIGAFVQVLLPGKALERVFAVPAEAVRLGSVVWIADAESRLRIRPVTVVRRTEAEALVAAGLEPGDRVVLTKIEGAVDGLRLRVQAASKANQRPDEVSLRSGPIAGPEERSRRHQREARRR